jgi:hypothetical protein
MTDAIKTNINSAVRLLNEARSHLEAEVRNHDDEHVRDLLSDLAEDIGAILVELETEFGTPPEGVFKGL